VLYTSRVYFWSDLLPNTWLFWFFNKEEKMASLIKSLIGGSGAAEDEPSGADIIGKLKNRLVPRVVNSQS